MYNYNKIWPFVSSLSSIKSILLKEFVQKNRVPGNICFRKELKYQIQISLKHVH